jgi:hypothetical protein
MARHWTVNPGDAGSIPAGGAARVAGKTPALKRTRQGPDVSLWIRRLVAMAPAWKVGWEREPPRRFESCRIRGYSAPRAATRGTPPPRNGSGGDRVSPLRPVPAAGETVARRSRECPRSSGGERSVHTGEAPGSKPGAGTVAVAGMVQRRVVVPESAGSSPVSHPVGAPELESRACL